MKMTADNWYSMASCLSIVVLLLAGCTAIAKTVLPPPPTPLSEQEIITLCQQKIPDEEIIKKISQKHGVYHLKTADVLRLTNAGVPARVIDAMLDTYTTEQLIQQRQYLQFRMGDPYWQDSLDNPDRRSVRP